MGILPGKGIGALVEWEVPNVGILPGKGIGHLVDWEVPDRILPGKLLAESVGCK